MNWRAYHNRSLFVVLGLEAQNQGAVRAILSLQVLEENMSHTPLVALDGGRRSVLAEASTPPLPPLSRDHLPVRLSLFL